MAGSGPSLKQLHAHHAIHEGGRSGAIDKTEEVKELLAAKEFEVAKQAAEHLVDYWETRILSHATSEEEGFYVEMAEQHPELKESVVQLTRDHDLLRIIVEDVKKILEQDGLTAEVLHRFDSLLIINEIHSRDEERILLEEPSK
ncbi:hemerythrin domain-containing protein [Indiicoccus explosivorum]|uniref:hemerythrin domain-containing protein n=1 Tax=Indiicoccus explosivorum TaxID=1917864 RepID=UPI000B44E852|nr:hemerythrin domain-containing protein [Indiicoccus explosivorum]